MTATDTPNRCPDCAVPVGMPHEDGCDVARCLFSGYQRLMCGGGHMDMGMPSLKVGEARCGRDVWTGVWPGEAECAEFGWWVQDRCAEGLGFVPCAQDAPGAMVDLNRLRRDAVWDRTAGRWRKRETAREGL